MSEVDFYKLSRSIQDRFVGSVNEGFAPAPILRAPGGVPTAFVWMGVSLASVITLLLVVRIGYGGLDSSLASHSGKAIVLYAILVFGAVLGVVSALGHQVGVRALPYPPGIYVFPFCLVDARRPTFKIHPLLDLAKSDGPDPAGKLRLVFPGGTFEFSLGGTASAKLAELLAVREHVRTVVASDDPGEMVAIDPLHVPRFSSPVGPADPYALATPLWAKFAWAVALAVAVVFGPSMLALRNAGSDHKMYARAVVANDVMSYRQYLERGIRHRDEVASVLLPRAELRDAEKQGTVAALLQWEKTHPSSKIETEARVAIRAAMLAELEKAKAKRTLSALDAFAKEYPDHGVEPELRAAIHAVYARELDAYREVAPSKDKVLPFVERLFAFAEKGGPRVEIRFWRKPSTSLTRADKYVAKTTTFMGEISYPSRYFDAGHAGRREQMLGKLLGARFAEGLPRELFDFELGAATDEPLPQVTVPTLFVSHGAEWSTHTYESKNPRGSFVGITFPFEATFVIPNDPKPFKFKVDIWKGAALSVLKESAAEGPAEERVYAAMATEAFDQFAVKLMSLFFKAAK